MCESIYIHNLCIDAYLQICRYASMHIYIYRYIHICIYTYIQTCGSPRTPGFPELPRAPQSCPRAPRALPVLPELWESSPQTPPGSGKYPPSGLAISGPCAKCKMNYFSKDCAAGFFQEFGPPAPQSSSELPRAPPELSQSSPRALPRLSQALESPPPSGLTISGQCAK